MCLYTRSLMSRTFFDKRSMCLVASTFAASSLLSACQSDSVAGNYAECSGQPGCQEMAAAVAPEVIQSLDDANSRALSVLPPAAQRSIETRLSKLKTALVQRDIDGGRVAFAAAINAINEAERASSESAPDLGVIRLGLVPAARSLGLPVSSTEAPAK